jgi:hypothetical protein
MILLLTLAAAAATAEPPVPTPLPAGGEARTVIDRQLASPPRSGTAAGLSAAEADAVMTRYIASIGTRIEREMPVERKAPR